MTEKTEKAKSAEPPMSRIELKAKEFVPKAHFEKYKEYYETNVLKPDIHSRLLEDIDFNCERAGIPKAALAWKMSKHCTKQEIEWVANFHLHKEKTGILLTGDVPVEDKMFCIAAACLRNFIDARVVPISRIIEEYRHKNEVSGTFILVPDFYIETVILQPYHISSITAWLIDRMTEEKRTCLYVNNPATLGTNYGQKVKSILDQNYKTMIP